MRALSWFGLGCATVLGFLTAVELVMRTTKALDDFTIDWGLPD